MRHYDIVDKYNKGFKEMFPGLGDELYIKMALTYYDEIDYRVLMGCNRPNGLFEKLGLKYEPKPAGIVDFDPLKVNP